METEEIAAKCRCGACGGKIGRLNLCQLDRLALWEYPVGGNVLTGEDRRAIAVLCDACVDGVIDVSGIREAVEFAGDEVFYHPVEELEPTPPPLTYVISPDGKAIQCIKCNRVSWHPLDVLNKYCGGCHQFHE